MYDSPRDAGRSGDVYAFSVVSAGAQFTLRTDHSSLRWLQRFRNEDGMLARWYLLLGQLSVTFEYRPGAQHANADGMSRQCGQSQQPDCPVSATDSPVPDAEPKTGLVDQPFTSSEMGKSMDADLLPELSGETWVASALLEEFTADLLPAGADLDLIAASRQDATLATVREWIQSESIPMWAECAGLSPELRCWRLQVGNLFIDTDGRLWRRRVRRRWALNWWFLRVSEEIPPLAICGPFGDFWDGISPSDSCVLARTTTGRLMWHLALCASQGNPHAPGGRQWDM